MRLAVSPVAASFGWFVFSPAGWVTSFAVDGVLVEAREDVINAINSSVQQLFGGDEEVHSIFVGGGGWFNGLEELNWLVEVWSGGGSHCDIQHLLFHCVD